MKFNIGGFTHKGTGIYSSNEDNLLINGNQLNEGELILPDQVTCTCFVSDGVGGNNAGDFASAFVLSNIKKLSTDELKDLNNILPKVNESLIEASIYDDNRRGCACTLSGMVALDDYIDFIQIGDSEIWLLRNDMFLKISKDEVVDEDNIHSPITNYLGGLKSNLKINTEWEKPELVPNDIYLICSDGLFKSLNIKLVKLILSSSKTLQEKILKLKENCLTLGSTDNVTAIIIEFMGF